MRFAAAGRPGVDPQAMQDGMDPPTRIEPAAGDVAHLGEELRAARLALGHGIEAFAAVLRIRAAYLEALEAGRLRDLPAPVYVLGYARSYARALGLDAEDFVRRFREAAGRADHERTELVFPESRVDRRVPGRAVLLPVLGAVLVVLGAYAGWWAWSGDASPRMVDATPSPPPAPAQVAAGAGGAAEAQPVASSSPSSGATPVAALPPPGPGTPMAAAAGPEAGRLVLRAQAETWVQVRVGQGGPVLLNRVMQPGESWTAPAREGLLLSTGNAGGLEMLVDGQPVPGLGGARAVRREVPISPERLKAGPIPPPPQ